MAIAGVPGLSIGIIDGTSNTTRMYHIGYRDVDNKLAPNDHTRYNINSLTKGIVAALAGIEVFRSQQARHGGYHGTISWSQPVRTWLPEIAGLASNSRTESTLVDLLSHRVGVTGLDDIWMGADNVVYLLRPEAIKTFASLEIPEPVRTSFEYSNWNYELVGQVLQRATGETVSELLESRLFTPLGMQRTSTWWAESYNNEARSHCALPASASAPLVQVPRPSLGNGTIMETAGGVKSTLHDLLIFFKTFMQEVKAQFDSNVDSTEASPFKFCRMLTTNSARLPGESLREQGYGMGWVRAQLPAQLGRISANAAVGAGPVVGKGGPSHLVLYNHGCMPGSTSGVWLLPEIQAGIVVLQNSLALIDTADFIGQLLLEIILQTSQPNDYVEWSQTFQAKAERHIDRLKADLEQHRVPGTHARPLCAYEGRFWNELHNFFIDVTVHNTSGALQMTWQGLDSQSYELHHYHYDTFSWLMPAEEIVRRARGVTFYNYEYYLVEFGSDTNNDNASDRVDYLRWSMDSNSTSGKMEFRKHAARKNTTPVSSKLCRVCDCCADEIFPCCIFQSSILHMVVKYGQRVLGLP